jgi:hypothetical protein
MRRKTIAKIMQALLDESYALTSPYDVENALEEVTHSAMSDFFYKDEEPIDVKAKIKDVLGGGNCPKGCGARKMVGNSPKKPCGTERSGCCNTCWCCCTCEKKVV